MITFLMTNGQGNSYIPPQNLVCGGYKKLRYCMNDLNGKHGNILLMFL